MKVLWIVNIIFPEAQALLNGHRKLIASGGWMLSAASALLDQHGIDLTVASPSSSVNGLTKLQGERIGYFLFPLGKGNQKKNDEYRKYWRAIHNQIRPDVVHIYGTEFSHGLAYVDECGAKNVLVSIQGLTSEIAKYYSLGLTKAQIIRYMSLGDIFRGSILRDVRKYKERGEIEKELLNKVEHVIGRTGFDRSHVWSINQRINYHFCNEILREEFFEGQWTYKACTPLSIFVSQGNYPVKGLHYMLAALRKVKTQYSSVKLQIAGCDIISHKNSLRGVYAYSGYGRYIKHLIKQYGLQNNVVFTGPYTASQMKAALLDANVFVCSSTIENSPNSLAEAQILGVPCIAAYVGGIPDMIPNEQCGVLYRCEDVDALAFHICGVFESSHRFDNTAMIQTARNRHDPLINTEQLTTIYNELIGKYEK